MPQINRKMSQISATAEKLIVDFSFFQSMPIVKLEAFKEEFETDQGHDSSVKRFAVLRLPKVIKLRKTVFVASGS